METALAMALGASVAPEMMVTPMTSARMPSRTGWSPACERNTERVNSMPEPYPDEADRTQTHLPILAQRLHARKMTLRVNSNPGCGRTGVVSLRAPCGRAAKNVGTRPDAGARKYHGVRKIHMAARMRRAILIQLVGKPMGARNVGPRDMFVAPRSLLLQANMVRINHHDEGSPI